jgi:hypothetical protein
VADFIKLGTVHIKFGTVYIKFGTVHLRFGKKNQIQPHLIFFTAEFLNTGLGPMLLSVTTPLACAVRDCFNLLEAKEICLVPSSHRRMRKIDAWNSYPSVSPCSPTEEVRSNIT